jgi:hypothetical protein
MEIQHASGPKVSARFLLMVAVLGEVLLAIALPSVYKWQPVIGVALFALTVGIAAGSTVHMLSKRKR